MELVVEELGFKLVPHREGLCYELWRWVSEHTVTSGKYLGRVVPASYISTGKYPRDISQGLKMMLEQSVNASKQMAVSIEEAVEVILAATEAIMTAVTEQLSPEGTARVSTI